MQYIIYPNFSMKRYLSCIITTVKTVLYLSDRHRITELLNAPILAYLFETKL
jgi:hypothetical protein